MKKTKLALILSNIFFLLQFAYADMFAEGTVLEKPDKPIIGDALAGKQADSGGYYSFGDLYIGPGPSGKVIVNNGTKLKTGEIHVGNNGTGDGTLIVDGAGTKIEIINNRLNVGGSSSKGTLYVTNGAELIQSNAVHDNNYFGYDTPNGPAPKTARIYVQGKDSKITLNLGQRGISTLDSEVYLEDGGTLEINGKWQVWLDKVFNRSGNLIVQKPLIVRNLQIGSDDGTKGGAVNFAEGITIWANLVVNKLAEEKIILPLNGESISIQHNANESLFLFKNSDKAITTGLLRINKGTVGIEDQNTFDSFKTSYLIDLKPSATFSLTNIGKTDPAAVGATDVKAKNFEHLGILDLADGTNSPKFTEFTVENYKGGGLLLVDSLWNKDTQTSGTDTLHIKGNINPDGITTVKTKNGIWGDITQTTEEQFLSLPVVKVASEHANNLFVGKSPTQNGGEAQLLKIGNDYYWSLKARLPDPVVPNKPEVTPDNPPVVPNKPEVKPN
ncbi:hypothetical protein ACT2CV_08950, partial [Pasteurellaceae bacterium 22721_9_1]